MVSRRNKAGRAHDKDALAHMTGLGALMTRDYARDRGILSRQIFLCSYRFV